MSGLAPLVPIITNGVELMYVMYLTFILICVSITYLDDRSLTSLFLFQKYNISVRPKTDSFFLHFYISPSGFSVRLFLSLFGCFFIRLS